MNESFVEISDFYPFYCSNSLFDTFIVHRISIAVVGWKKEEGQNSSESVNISNKARDVFCIED